MALDLTGIQNVEFYSGHYLDAVLEGDLKAVFSRWSEAESEGEIPRTPQKALASLSTRYLEARAQAEGIKSSVERWKIAREFHAHFVEALGYPYKPAAEPLEGDEVIPVVTSLQRDGRPFLWILDSGFPLGEDDNPLDDYPHLGQLPKGAKGGDLPMDRWQDLLTERIFQLERPPRWVLFLSGNEALLTERHKWSQGKCLRFQIGEILGRKEAKALRAVAGLLHRDVLAPDAGVCLHDTLEENSHKHAFAVSADLKHGVRRSVELLANEAVWYRREKQKLGVFNEEELSEKLTAESLTWLYRMLFLFFVEARSTELDVVPMGSDTYREGYSLEALRDLELVPLTTAQAREGYFIHDSLKKLLAIVNAGFPAEDRRRVLPYDDVYQHSMRIQPVNSPLFDDDRLEILKGVRFRNQVLQEILQLLSLSAEKKKKARGRISYAQLGINQLGAVYEGLLSYTGFFAKEDLYEVASEKDNKTLSGKPAAERESLKTYFVPASRISDYKDGEIVKAENGKPVKHPRGDFIFRLAGRNREKSASYYTPEVLTKCLVKYALKELLWEEGEEGGKPRPRQERKRKKTADEILALTICEPAMGSSAFLIEAVDQLADAYLEARQEEKGETIPPEDYQREKRRVKARLATNNCYGVDLNPTAVELAKVSLWLATLHEDGKCPWFGLRLATGNSLVGARREVFKTADVTRKGTKDNPNWLGLVPEPVSLHHGDDARPPEEVDWANWTAPPRPKGTIYHFLLPAEGMAAFDKDKVIKQLAPESVKRIKEWRKEFCQPFSKTDAKRLEQISDAVDLLLAQVVRERVLATQKTSDRIPVWGEPLSAQQADLLVRDQEEVAASLEDGSSAYRRLKLAMDAWCALWFWPIEEAGLLPGRATWIAQLELILKGQVSHEPAFVQGNLFADLSRAPEDEMTGQSTSGDTRPRLEASGERLKRLQELSDQFRERRADYFDQCGLSDIEVLIEGDSTLRAAQRVADRILFQHWQLRFAEAFALRGGFDLILGNPPWVRLEWNEGALLGDGDPQMAIRGLSATQREASRSRILAHVAARAEYQAELEEVQGTQSFLTATGNFDLLSGVKPNVYKAFILIGWNIGNESGIAALLHPEGIYTETSGTRFRKALYRRLALHLHFRNEYPLFSDVMHTRQFGINVFQSRHQNRVQFQTLTNLFHPATVDSCFQHDGAGPVPGIKSALGGWEFRGHRRRLILVDEHRLRSFARIYDEDPNTWEGTTLPIAHSEDVLDVIRALSRDGKRLGDISSDVFSTNMFDETATQRSGVIGKATTRPARPGDLILQGPHFFVGTPFSKTPNEACRNYLDYSRIDIASIDENYLPRTNYAPSIEGSKYRDSVPKWKGEPVTNCYRHIHRDMVSLTGERALVSSIAPPGVGHVHAVFSVVFRDQLQLLVFSGLSSSLLLDFLVKTSGREHVTKGLTERFPVIDASPELTNRVLRLNAITTHYSELWAAGICRDAAADVFASRDMRFRNWANLSDQWDPSSPLRSDLERRQALLEVDVLSAFGLGVALEGLLAIYNINFPKLQEYERERVYDQHGRLVASSKTVAGNPAVSLVELAATLKEQAGFDVHAEYHPDGSNTQELRKQKIRLGKKEADVLGVSERCTMADLLAETEVRWSDEDHPEGRPVRLVGLRYTDPGLEPRMERVYPTPWTRCDREADYRQAWTEFERRLGKKMPEGTPL